MVHPAIAVSYVASFTCCVWCAAAYLRRCPSGGLEWLVRRTVRWDEGDEELRRKMLLVPVMAWLGMIFAPLFLVGLWGLPSAWGRDRLVALLNLSTTGSFVAGSGGAAAWAAVRQSLPLHVCEVWLALCLAGVLAGDMGCAVRGSSMQIWPLAVIVLDVLLVIGASRRASSFTCAGTTLYLMLRNAYTVHRYVFGGGIHLQAPEGGRTLPVFVIWLFLNTIMSSAPLVLDFYFTRGFASEMTRQKVTVDASVEMAEHVTMHLALYRVEEARALINSESGDALPPQLRDALSQLIDNLSVYRNFLPQSCLPDECVGDEDDVNSWEEELGMAPPRAPLTAAPAAAWGFADGASPAPTPAAASRSPKGRRRRPPPRLQQPGSRACSSAEGTESTVSVMPSPSPASPGIGAAVMLKAAFAPRSPLVVPDGMKTPRGPTVGVSVGGGDQLQRRAVTLVAANIRGYLTAADAEPPAALQAFHHRHAARMVAAVAAHRSVTDALSADRLLASANGARRVVDHRAVGARLAWELSAAAGPPKPAPPPPAAVASPSHGMIPVHSASLAATVVSSPRHRIVSPTASPRAMDRSHGSLLRGNATSFGRLDQSTTGSHPFMTQSSAALTTWSGSARVRVRSLGAGSVGSSSGDADSPMSLSPGGGALSREPSTPALTTVRVQSFRRQPGGSGNIRLRAEPSLLSLRARRREQRGSVPSTPAGGRPARLSTSLSPGVSPRGLSKSGGVSKAGSTTTAGAPAAGRRPGTSGGPGPAPAAHLTSPRAPAAPGHAPPSLAAAEASAAACSGELLCGVLGCEGLLRFSFVGPAAAWVHAAERLATKWGCAALASGAVKAQAEQAYTFRLRAAAAMGKPSHAARAAQPLWQLVAPIAAPEEAAEWMYELEQHARADPWRHLNGALEDFYAGRHDAALGQAEWGRGELAADADPRRRAELSRQYALVEAAALSRPAQPHAVLYEAHLDRTLQQLAVAHLTGASPAAPREAPVSPSVGRVVAEARATRDAHEHSRAEDLAQQQRALAQRVELKRMERSCRAHGLSRPTSPAPEPHDDVLATAPQVALTAATPPELPHPFGLGGGDASAVPPPPFALGGGDTDSSNNTKPSARVGAAADGSRPAALGGAASAAQRRVSGRSQEMRTAGCVEI